MGALSLAPAASSHRSISVAHSGKCLGVIPMLLLLLSTLPLVPKQVPAAAAAASGLLERVPEPRQLHSSAHHSHQDQDLRQQLLVALPLVSGSSSSSLGGATHHPDAPKLIPLSALERYQEGAELKLFCSASASASAGRIQLEWRKNHNEPLATGSGSLAEPGERTIKQNGNRLHINMMDDSSSVLRITDLEADDSGNYTCFARNQHGFDSSTVRINVNVRLKWLREPPAELQVRAGKSVYLECDASGQPTPLISWTSLKDHQTTNSKVLRFDRAQVNDSGLYECRASNSPQQKHLAGGGSYMDAGGVNNGEHLRKLVRIVVNGK